MSDKHDVHHDFQLVSPPFVLSFIPVFVLQSGVNEQRSTNSCLFCCPKGTIIVSASLKRRAYAPGEDIVIFADVINMSNTPIHRSCVKLIQVNILYSVSGSYRAFNRPSV
jgi:hypothetical protein